MKTFQEIKEKYGNVPLKFSHYYKYSFTFKGTTQDGEDILVTYGGDSDDIYRFEVSIYRDETLNSLEPNYLQVSRNGKEVFSWNNW